MILEGGGLQLPKKVAAQGKLRGGHAGLKTGAVVWQWVATFKDAVPPPPPSGPTIHYLIHYSPCCVTGGPHKEQRTPSSWKYSVDK